jgi:uncharacterized protein (DUF488 family)
MKIVTIGGYGFDEASFMKALSQARVGIFVDVRQRRGLRGRRYSFLNSSKLQALLKGAGIRYIYIPQLAPTSSIRALQKTSDEIAGVLKSQRQRLSAEFVAGYKAEILQPFENEHFLSAIRGAEVVALFCVEGEPYACHRSIAAQYFSEELNLETEHIRP